MELNKTWPTNGPLFRFQKWVWRFVNEKSLLQTGDQVLVAVSTGADSMAMLILAIWWKKLGLLRSVRVVHVNHQTRKQCQEEESFIRDFCSGHGVQLAVEHWNKKVTANFEQEARSYRDSVFHHHLHEGEKLLLGHHLDDSFEWSLMQQMRSGQLRSSIGIPLLNGRKLRPLLCVTRQQIEWFLRGMGVTYFNDHTNFDLKYERNFIRSQLIPLIKKRNPQYLKHYVARSEQLAELLGLHLVKRSTFKVFRGPNATLFLHEENSRLPTSLLRREIQRLSRSQRGTLGEQLEKLNQLSAGKEGPMSLSGQLEVMREGRFTFIYQAPLAQVLSSAETVELSFSEFENELMRRIFDGIGKFPYFLCVNDTGWRVRFRKKNHHLFPTLDLSENETILTASSLLKQWKQNKRWQNHRIKVGFLF